MTSEPVGGSARAHLRGPRIILAAHGVGLPVVDPGGRVQALEGPRDHDHQRRSDGHHGPGQRRQQATGTESCRHCSRRHLWLHGPADGGEGELMALHASSSRARQRSPAGRHEGVRRRGASHQERDHRSLRHRDRDTMVKMLGNGEASPADNIYMRRIISLNTMGGDVERGLAPSWRSSARRCGQANTSIGWLSCVAEPTAPWIARKLSSGVRQEVQTRQVVSSTSLMYAGCPSRTTTCRSRPGCSRRGVHKTAPVAALRARASLPGLAGSATQTAPRRPRK